MKGPRIPIELLPRCKNTKCGGLLRPHVVWFNENLDSKILKSVGIVGEKKDFSEASILHSFLYISDEKLKNCDLCLLVGTSSVVYPAAMFAPELASRGIPVAEFNMETTPATHHFG